MTINMNKLFLVLFCGLLANASFAEKGLIPFRELDKYGYLDLSGKVVIPARFDKTFPFSEGVGRFAHQDLFGYINADARLIVGNVFKEAFDFKEGLARVKDGPVWSFIDKTGKEKFTVVGEKVTDFENGHAIFSRKGFFGYINKGGKEIFPPILTQAEHFINGVARVNVGQFYGLIDETGELVIPLVCDYVGIPMDNEFIRVKTGGFWYVYTIKGEKVCRASESISGEFSNGMAVIRVMDKSLIVWKKYMNGQGKIPIEKDFIWAGTFSNNVAVVKDEVDDKVLFGVIGKEGSYIVEPQFTKTSGTYSEGFLGVEKDGKWGFIDTRGNWLVKPTYDEVNPFKNGYAMVSKGLRKWGIIDNKGNLIIECDYDIVMEGEYFFVAILGYYKSYYDQNGVLIWADKPDEE